MPRTFVSHFVIKRKKKHIFRREKLPFHLFCIVNIGIVDLTISIPALSSPTFFLSKHEFGRG